MHAYSLCEEERVKDVKRRLASEVKDFVADLGLSLANGGVGCQLLNGLFKLLLIKRWNLPRAGKGCVVKAKPILPFL